MNRTIHILILLFLIFGLESYAQKTTVKGKVIDFQTKEPVAFASVNFQDSKIGTTTNIKGEYLIDTYYIKDSLLVSSIGFFPTAKRVIPDVEQILNFELKEAEYELTEIVIKAGKVINPAHEIFKNIIANKNINNREKLDAYEYEIYNKVEIDVQDPNEKFINFILWRPIDFVFDNIDSISEENPFLPAFISETVSEFYYRKEPNASKEIVKATEISGFQNESISRLLGDMYQNVNIYDNQIVVFDRSFVSPLSNQGLLNYRYYLADSASIDGKWCYKLLFQPRRKQELTFDGYFWVNDTTYAIKEIEATIPKDANINFVTDLKVHQKYSEVEPEVWMLTHDQLKMNARFLMPHNAKYQKFVGRKNTTYDKFIINKPREDSLYKEEPRVLVLDSAEDRSLEEWEEIRHIPLSISEASIYSMVDSVKKSKYYKNWADLLRGYYRVGYIEFGPYFSTYSYNSIEGDRFRLGARTSKLLNPDLRVNTYAAYGLFDEEWKYGLSARFFPKRTPRQFVKLSYKKDLEQLGAGSQALGTDNLLSSAGRRTTGNLMNGVEEYLGLYQRTWNEKITSTLQFQHRKIWTPSTGDLVFKKLNESDFVEEIESLTIAEISLGTHFSYKESFIESQFSRTSLGSNFPMLDVQYNYGIKGFVGSQYEYHKTVVGVSQKVRLGIYGTSRYNVSAGKIWGDLPYPLLELHNGNETYFFNDFSFNLMNYYEFASDQYVSAFAEHHFQGLFFNKLPAIRKMMLREVVSAKAVYGTLDTKTQNEMILPLGLSSLHEPYMEVAVGIENILTALRIDAIWRLNYLDNPGAIPFGIRAKLQVGF
jgi:hypothetical protein